ncbi:hypothetical protein EEL34_02335 [Muribaculaceae bacterium Isolate-039 (Harlan)]|uniref:hypothetical protein n=1 Tax=uncultured Duncaniella sp. TaxID=2768039 RepID=UPI000F51F965|nr:hypothetical protein [uncultured Duncaniella sp.]ROS91571.1 hypothetical protein EEL34_02335 [Muribaculaceae bacterium Isolate-039 (Harlan)]
MSEDIELDKLRILLNAVEAIEDEEPDFYAVLKEAAWNVLHENPGIGFDEWVQTLMEQYPSEVVDAIGSHPAETYASLADMWETEDYEDAETGECHSFKDWAEYFATEQSIELYDLLAEARANIRRIETRQPQRQPNPQPRLQSPAEGQI